MARMARLGKLGPVVLAAALASGCGGSSGGSTTPAPAYSRPASPPAGSAGIAQCLRKHGLALPTGKPGAGGPGIPAGGIPQSFRKALKACGVPAPGGFGG
jgi:hypothetical protein